MTAELCNHSQDLHWKVAKIILTVILLANAVHVAQLVVSGIGQPVCPWDGWGTAHSMAIGRDRKRQPIFNTLLQFTTLVHQTCSGNAI